MIKIPKIKKSLKKFIVEQDGMTTKSKVLVAGLLISAIASSEDVRAASAHESCYQVHSSGTSAKNHGNCPDPYINVPAQVHSSTASGGHQNTHGNWSHVSGHCSNQADAVPRHANSHASEAGTLTSTGSPMHGSHDHCADEHGNAYVNPPAASHSSDHGND